MSVVGIIARDDSWLTLPYCNIKLGFLSPLFIELKAIWHGMKLAFEQNWKSFNINSNSKFAVDLCNSTSLWLDSQNFMIHQIWCMISEFSFTVSYVNKLLNSSAHWSAKNGLFQSFDSHDFVYLPRPLMWILYFKRLSICNYGISPPQVKAINKT